MSSVHDYLLVRDSNILITSKRVPKKPFTHTQTYTYTHAHTHTLKHARTRAHACKRTYTRTHRHAHTYTYTQAQALFLLIRTDAHVLVHAQTHTYDMQTPHTTHTHAYTSTHTWYVHACAATNDHVPLVAQQNVTRGRVMPQLSIFKQRGRVIKQNVTCNII